MDDLLKSLRCEYDYIIIDCGLQHELLTVNALRIKTCLYGVNHIQYVWDALASQKMRLHRNDTVVRSRKGIDGKQFMLPPRLSRSIHWQICYWLLSTAQRILTGIYSAQ